jgi:ASC-1-like (ASCH) protein
MNYDKREPRPPREISELGINGRWLEQIRNGSKDLELRLNWGSARHIKVGQKLKLVDNETHTQDVNIQILDKREYPNIEAVIQHENVGRIVPGSTPKTFREGWLKNKMSRAEAESILIFEIKLFKETE